MEKFCEVVELMRQVGGTVESPLMLLIVAPVPEELRTDLCLVLQGRRDGCARASGGLVLSQGVHDGM